MTPAARAGRRAGSLAPRAPGRGSRADHPQSGKADVLFVLGAADPEMHAIEHLLAGYSVPLLHAAVDGKRVYPANAYKAVVPQVAIGILAHRGKVFLVECIERAPPDARRIDHHRPGDPGYGRPAAEFWQASSIGQTVVALADGIVERITVTPEMRMVAAADHCLGAAYRGECPGIDPAVLLD